MMPYVSRWHRPARAFRTLSSLRHWSREASTQGVPFQAAAGSAGRGKDQARLAGLLPNAQHGEVCTRFPPEPSGYLHIGHAKAAILNNYYARHYGGRLILRFDDTNPSKSTLNFEQSIVKDLATLEVYPDNVSRTSDHFPALAQAMEGMLRRGVAYVDDTDMERMREERDAGIASVRRSRPVEENLRLWQEMLKGSEEGLACCVRGKLDMASKNKCLRDPVFYRCRVDTPHHVTKRRFNAYPTYDFACPVVDALEGVTHALRTLEFRDRDDMYHWVQANADLKKVELVEFSKSQFQYTVLSKRKLAWFVESGHVSGWDDPRLPTVQGVMRRGMTVAALSEFVMTLGMSKATHFMEWDKVWALNRQKIDPIVPRFFAVLEEGAVQLQLDGPALPDGVLVQKHPKNPDLGKRLVIRCSSVWVEQEDAQDIRDGEEITLMRWGNVIIQEVIRDPDTGHVLRMVGRLHPGGSVKGTRKIHWVGQLDGQVTRVILREFDHLVTKPKVEEDDSIPDIVAKQSLIDSPAIGDPMLKTLAKGERLQLERRGHFIVDSQAFPPGEPMVLIKIPDGKARDMSMASKVDPARWRGSGKAKSAGPPGERAAV